MEIQYLFIIGQSRCGSKFYLQHLNDVPNIYIAPEQVFRFKFKKNQFDIIKKLLIRNPYDYENIILGVYQAKLKNTITQLYESVGTDALIDFLKLKNEPITNPYVILKSLLELKAKQSGASIVGVKFPVHSSYAAQLLNYFPDAKFLFISRDPRSILSSDLIKKRSRVMKGTNEYPFKGVLLRPSLLLFTLFEFLSLTRSFERLKKENGDAIFLSKYSSIINSKESVRESINEWLRIEYLCDSELKILDSSFGEIKINRNQHLRFYERAIFKVLVGKRIKRYS